MVLYAKERRGIGMCTNLVIMIMIIMASVVCVMMIIGHTHTHKSWSSTTFLVVVVLVDVVVNVINGESTIKPPQPSTTVVFELVCGVTETPHKTEKPQYLPMLVFEFWTHEYHYRSPIACWSQECPRSGRTEWTNCSRCLPKYEYKQNDWIPHQTNTHAPNSPQSNRLCPNWPCSACPCPERECHGIRSARLASTVNKGKRKTETEN